MATIDAVLNTIDANLPASTQRLFDLLSIPSVSTDPAFTQHCQRAANWLADQLKGLGYTADVHETPGHPIVVGHAKAKRKDAPHVLFYGHYDVQPADPLGLWESDPFAPRLAAGKDGDEIVARGASDDKGQLMTFIEACRAFEENGGLPCNVTFLFEGEEETGSPSLPGFLAANKDELSQPDIALVCDTSMWNATTPAITVMLRGLAQEEVFIRIASHDLHSGMFGGPVNNPVHVLAKIIADLHDEEGKVTLPGFYAGVPEIPEDIAEQWRALDFDEATWLGEIGLTRIGGEKGCGILEQIWARPTCDVNGVVGGYTGKGSKTVLPAEASAKFSFRLVGKQDAKAVLESFRAFVKERLPADAKVEFINHGASNALQLPFGSEALNRARRALTEEWGKEAALAGCGGSIPIVGAFKRDLNMDALMIGFALDDDRIHSPNEKYSYTSFHKGARSWARVLDALAS
ncbi:M20/M25/M40 family metallo-hydrolase [Methylocystis sp. MJC1]|jgi:acetylornithine deacetylase/succinyl-diaminopimelate desuccinylase-like protein|uniref:M20/M25/M40 family metallo-hydrolase n=1 Tax=Methylocystis sp. MJC1 TaxID=2654282 RepID=UPI0013ED78D5|nr:M20/M25/M40 family metallo-hydrolase [Methylocystis sp. MJC1]KAF2991858.1 Succinyl-diaminopimelate desuccinylase [Methylocystis sp. MJC1]MBU6528961.1 M20/M25/M40 family metallo-hydrolase [Methylocystis sp. MJC1]UZX11844.1 M20/M25/M40 family metallo-hydrolase [Methylocystis sp. MJC1]